MRAISAGLAMIVLLVCGMPASPAAEPVELPVLKVDGKQLKTPQGTVVRLRGLNLPSLEWGQGEHLFDSLKVAVGEWGVNVIRLPLSQDRWFGRAKDNKDGVRYRKTVQRFVKEAAARKCYVILDLHWSDAGRWGEDMGQHKMPDDNSAAFWGDVAVAFANQPAVLFDLYNEPYGVSWNVWRNGGKVVEASKKAPDGKREYHTPGMQGLLDICRAKGARNVVVVGGLDWGYDLSSVAKGDALADPKGNGVVYDTHLYPWKKDWERHVTPTADKYAVMVGEFCTLQAMQYSDQHGLSWTAWCLHPSASPCLIKDWKYTPTAYGELVKTALRKAAAKR